MSVVERFDFDAGGLLGGKSSLRLFNLTTELLRGALVLSDVPARLLLVHLHEVLHDALVEIFPSQVGVSAGGDDLENPVVNFQ